MSTYLDKIESIIAEIKTVQSGIDEAQIDTILQTHLAPLQAEADQSKADLAAANQQISDLQQATTDLANAEAGTTDSVAGAAPTTTDTTTGGTDTTTGASS